MFPKIVGLPPKSSGVPLFSPSILGYPFFFGNKNTYGGLVVPQLFAQWQFLPFVTNSCCFFVVMLSFHCSCVFFVIFVQDIVQTVEDLIFEMGHSVCFKRGRGGTSMDLKSECS